MRKDSETWEARHAGYEMNHDEPEGDLDGWPLFLMAILAPIWLPIFFTAYLVMEFLRLQASHKVFYTFLTLAAAYFGWHVYCAVHTGAWKF